MLVGVFTMGHAATSHSNRDKDIASIHSNLNSFSALADNNAYEYLTLLFAPHVTTDYTSLFGGEAVTQKREILMQNWAAFLPGFDKTFHNLGNPSINRKEDIAFANVPFTASHWLGHDGFWQVSGIYHFTFRKIEGQWLITSVTLEKREEAGSRDILAIAPENAKDRLADLQQLKNDTLVH
tara:strand:- start:3329 stop:3871 length:543 start_codon:yes stop_codon:yes gene_type:complete